MIVVAPRILVVTVTIVVLAVVDLAVRCVAVVLIVVIRDLLAHQNAVVDALTLVTAELVEDLPLLLHAEAVVVMHGHVMTHRLVEELRTVGIVAVVMTDAVVGVPVEVTVDAAASLVPVPGRIVVKRRREDAKAHHKQCAFEWIKSLIVHRGLSL